MKLIVLKSNLLESILSVERATGGSSSLPILKNVLLKTEEGKIILTATNLELAITHSFSGKIIENGEITIPLAIFSSIVRNLNSERITLELKGKKIYITTENYEAVIQGQDTKEFPIIPELHNKTQYLQMSASVFTEAINSVIVATQYSEIRPEISGIFVCSESNAVTLVATDSFRLAERKLDSNQIKSTLNGTKVIIPLRTAEEVLKIFSSKPDENINIFIDPTQILFKTETIKAVSRLIDGNFPDYQSIIPKQIKTEVFVPRQEFINAVKLTSSFSGRANDISISVGDNKKFVELSSSDSALGENHYKVPIRLKGEKFDLVFNWKYIIDGLKIFKGKEVMLGVNSPDKPILIKSLEEQHLFYVAMPIRG